MPSSGMPGLRPLTPVLVKPEEYPGGSGRCMCTWSFLDRSREWLLKYVYAACFYSGGEEGPHYLLAERIARATGRSIL
jgi:hypothetical protein